MHGPVDVDALKAGDWFFDWSSKAIGQFLRRDVTSNVDSFWFYFPAYESETSDGVITYSKGGVLKYLSPTAAPKWSVNSMPMLLTDAEIDAVQMPPKLQGWDDKKVYQYAARHLERAVLKKVIAVIKNNDLSAQNNERLEYRKALIRELTGRANAKTKGD